MKETIDLSLFEAQDTADMAVAHPATGEPTSWVITFAGPGHPQTVAIADRIGRRELEADRRKEQAQVNGRKWKPDERDLPEQRKENARLIVDRIVGWSPVKVNGKDYPFTPENAMALMLNPRQSKLLRQCFDFLTADDAFFGGSAKTSSPSPSTNSD